MTLSKSQRAAVFAMFDGHCAYCGIELPERGWQADHIEALERVMTYVRDSPFGELKRKLLRCASSVALMCPARSRASTARRLCTGTDGLTRWREATSYAPATSSLPASKANAIPASQTSSQRPTNLHSWLIDVRGGRV